MAVVRSYTDAEKNTLLEEFKENRTEHWTQISTKDLNRLESKACEIHVLRLSNAVLMSEQMRNFKSVMVKNESVKVLDLSFTWDESVSPKQRTLFYKQIAGIIKRNTSLEALFLDGNAVSKRGASLLAKALQEKPLQQLSLCNCKFESNDSLCEILENLKNSTEVAQINISGAVSIADLRKVPFAFKALYEEMGNKLIVDNDVRDLMLKLKEEEQQIMGSKTERVPPEQRRLKLPEYKRSTLPVRGTRFFGEAKLLVVRQHELVRFPKLITAEKSPRTPRQFFPQGNIKLPQLPAQTRQKRSNTK